MQSLRNRSRAGRTRQAGFSLIEMLVVMAILAILAVLAASSFDGARTKAQAMISLGKQVGDANIQLKLDTGCYVNKPKALFDPATALDSSNNYCSRSFGNSWSRAYMAKYTTDSSGSLVIDKIGAGVTVAFPSTPEAATSGGVSLKRYYVRFANVPNDIIRAALLECNNDSTIAGDFDSYKCRSDATLTGDTPGNFDILFDETR